MIHGLLSMIHVGFCFPVPGTNVDLITPHCAILINILTFRHLSVEVEHESCEHHDVEMDGLGYIYILPLE